MKISRKMAGCALVVMVSVLGLQGIAEAGSRDRDHREDRGSRWSHERPQVGHRRSSLPLFVFRLSWGGSTYFYDEGAYYIRDGRDYVAINPPVGVVVRRLPSYYQSVVVNGVLYYVSGGTHYVRVHGGYQVVPAPIRIVQAPPIVVEAPPVTVVPESATRVITPLAPSRTDVFSVVSNEEESFVVNIPNDMGRYTPVAIKRLDEGFVGPQGEMYADFPKVAQLQLMYGKQ